MKSENRKNPRDNERPFLTLSETSEYLGLSRATLYGYTSKGIIPFYKLQNRKLYFKIDELNGFILCEKNRVKSAKEIESEAAIQLLTNRKACRR
ncbi:MAG: helix-turn-helix domain-containing protein [Candidatus Cloacimonetes bacterium]|nr:helix-turn-helix domain-containing protein [Candidatus Cloacimonadota bacterium]